jgi:PTS system nitrogen regulatory IIA component
MKWNLREAARALDMSEREVLRLARAGDLPALHINDQYLFNPADLQEWGTQRHRKMTPDVMPPNGTLPQRLSLADAIERGGVYEDVAGSNSNEVLDAVAHLPGVPTHIDRGLLAAVLRSREGLVSTGIGGGIAVPHPRDPLVVHVDAPIVLLCFLARGVDFKAIDGQPVRVLFTLLSPTIPLHLRLLSRLAHALHDDVLCRLLAETTAHDAIVPRIRELELRMNRSAPENGSAPGGSAR